MTIRDLYATASGKRQPGMHHVDDSAVKMVEIQELLVIGPQWELTMLNIGQQLPQSRKSRCFGPLPPKTQPPDAAYGAPPPL